MEEPVSGKRLAKRILSINMAICSYEDNVDRPLSRLITLEHIRRRMFMPYFSVALATMLLPTFPYEVEMILNGISTSLCGLAQLDQALYVNIESIMC